VPAAKPTLLDTVCAGIYERPGVNFADPDTDIKRKTLLMVLSRLTLQEKIGQMLLFGWQTQVQATALIEDLAVGGVILMGRNIEPPEQLPKTIARMQQQASKAGLPPLFVAVDQEGGRVQRLGPPNYAARLTAREIGTTNDPAQARMAARDIGVELHSQGFNWDFAPVLDVNNNPNNPVIGSRSYGNNAALVAMMGVAAVRGFQEDAGLLACGKHFPGHGDTDTDSHHALPRIPHDLAHMEAVELIPFRAAMEAGLAAVMTSHILFPALDAKLPATLSPAILTGLLRQKMGFEGLIITDDLEMKGVADGWGAAEAAVLAVQAGADILLCCHEWKTQQAIQAALLNALSNGRLTEGRLEQSVARVAGAKARWVSRRVQ